MLMMAQHDMATPVHPDAPNTHNFLHDDDIVTSLPYLLAEASTSVPIFNWCSPEIVSIEDWTVELTRLTGVEIPLETTMASIPPNPIDPTKLLALGWSPSVTWHHADDRLRSTANPDLNKG